jgi:uncharacterized protein (DUF983 family)
MSLPAHGFPPPPPEYSWSRFVWMMGNALRWKCPTCGQRPLFVPWSRVRSLQDWFMPLDGCPNCGYPFDREPGYFLLSIFAINYGVGSLLGLIIYLVLDFWVKLPIEWTILLVVVPMPIFNFWFSRHSKALFIAFDLFFDPHQRDDDGGDQRTDTPRKPPSPPVFEPAKR